MRSALRWITTLLVLGCGDASGPDRTLHEIPISRNETWSRADSPHIVRGRLAVSGNVTLTIEAGATVLFGTDAGLTFGGPAGSGTLQALGSSTAPITMGPLQEGAGPGAWIGLALRANTTSVLRFVNLSGCGSGRLGDSIPPGCLVLGNPILPDESPTVLVDHLTVEEGRGSAVALWNESRFAEGSSMLSVRNMSGHVARLRAREVARFPVGGSFTDNDSNEVRLATDTLSDSLTLASGVPWMIEGTILVEGPAEPVLTIPAGSTLRSSGEILVGPNAPGGVQIGSDGGPVVTLLPRALNSFWGGIRFHAYAVHSAIINTTLDSCGGGPSVCVMINGSFTGGPAPSPVLRNVTIHNAFGGGLSMTNRGRPGPGSENLTITGGTGYPVSLDHSLVSAIPSGHYSGNIQDFIWINQVEVRADETWPRFDVPYYVYNWVTVGDTLNRPTLTFEPGVTMISPPGVSLRVGETGPGAIHAVGTADQPITFTGEGNTPGSWTGIVIWFQADSSTVFEHVIVDNAGYEYPIAGSFHFYKDLGPVIRNSVIRNSAGCGVIIANGPVWSTDFTAPALGNTFSNNVGGPVCGP